MATARAFFDLRANGRAVPWKIAENAGASWSEDLTRLHDDDPTYAHYQVQDLTFHEEQHLVALIYAYKIVRRLYWSDPENLFRNLHGLFAKLLLDLPPSGPLGRRSVVEQVLKREQYGLYDALRERGWGQDQSLLTHARAIFRAIYVGLAMPRQWCKGYQEFLATSEEPVASWRDAQHWLPADLNAQAHLKLKYQTARRARAILVIAHMKLVRAMASRYPKNFTTFMDLVQEGTIGLLRAIDRFKPWYGLRLSTYARHLIRLMIFNHLATHHGPLSVPPKVYARAHGRDFAQQLHQNLDGLGEAELDGDASASRSRAKHKERRINIFLIRTISLLSRPVYLDQDVPSKSGRIGLDLLVDKASEDLLGEIERRMIVHALHEGLAVLSEREREVLFRHYGLGQHEPQTLAEIGNLLNITREGVRQIEERALRKLRQHSALSRFM